MRFLRTVSGCTRENKERNGDIRDKLIIFKLTMTLKVNNYRKESVDHKEKTEVTTNTTVTIKYKREKHVSDAQENDKQIRRCFVCYCKFHPVTGHEGQRGVEV
jgi:hypothetical protein